VGGGVGLAEIAPAVVVHGGAGAWQLAPGMLEAAVAACADAANAGRDALVRGGSALDAVEGAVRVLEDAPMLNAGRGSHPTTAGTIEMDALIMDGRTLDIGAVAAVRFVAHPVSLARLVMTSSAHALLVGEGAVAFARQQGFPLVDEADLRVERGTPAAHDTVGAVAIDADGNVAAATSTGGVRKQAPGRVGDSPLAGSGGYADNESAAVSATGPGEMIMRVVLSKLACDLVSAEVDAQAACDEALRVLARRTAAHAGLIGVDRYGRVAVSCNEPAMPYAIARGAADVESGTRGAG
jgi:beta-aspartyl-peptidase (threonine type)